MKKEPIPVLVMQARGNSAHLVAAFPTLPVGRLTTVMPVYDPKSESKMIRATVNTFERQHMPVSGNDASVQRMLQDAVLAATVAGLLEDEVTPIFITRIRREHNEQRVRNAQ